MSVFRKILGTYQMNNLMLDSVSYFVIFWSLLCYLVLTLSLYYIETRLLIYSGNQWTGFYITGTFVMKELNLYAKMTIIFAIKLITNEDMFSVLTCFWRKQAWVSSLKYTGLSFRKVVQQLSLKCFLKFCHIPCRLSNWTVVMIQN